MNNIDVIEDLRKKEQSMMLEGEEEQRFSCSSMLAGKNSIDIIEDLREKDNNSIIDKSRPTKKRSKHSRGKFIGWNGKKVVRKKKHSTKNTPQETIPLELSPPLPTMIGGPNRQLVANVKSNNYSVDILDEIAHLYSSTNDNADTI